MQKLNLPEYTFKFNVCNDKQQIFDVVRKKWVVLTEEEWVRQNFVAWLIHVKRCPLGLIAIEKELSLNSLKKRYDIVVYNSQHLPALLVECKAPGINVTQKVFDQAARYNMVLNVNYLVVTNGINHYCCFIDTFNKEFSFIDDVPEHDKLF